MYYNIDDILSEEYQVDVQLLQPLYLGSFLDDNISDKKDDLPEGHRMQLPFWMAKCLTEILRDDLNLAKLEVLEMFEDGQKDNLNADPNIINLNKESSYFFQLGLKFCDLMPEEVQEDRFKGAHSLRIALYEAYNKRQMKMNLSNDEFNLLTRIERQDYYLLKTIREEYEKWEQKLNKRQRGIMNKKQII